jgi:hypothetical protein
MKLSLDHIIVVHQNIDVPDTCPSCKESLIGDGKLKQWEFQDQSRDMTYRIVQDGEVELDCCNDLPQSGESFLSCSWHCSNCDHELASNNEERFDMDDPDRLPPPGLRDLLKLDGNSEVSG